MKTGFLVTARLKSSRLPKKLLMEVHGEPILTWMVRRLRQAPELDEIILCTSRNPQDDPIIEIAEREGVKWFRGSEEDVAERLCQAAIEFNLDYVINMTADCPLLPYDLIRDVILFYLETDADLVTCHHLPVGLYLSGLKVEALKRLIELKDSDYTEYWLYYFFKTDLFKVVQLPTNPNWDGKDYRVALDYPEDFEVIHGIYKGLGPNAYQVSTTELIDWMDAHPSLFEKNRHCNRKGEERTASDETAQVKLKRGNII